MSRDLQPVESRSTTFGLRWYLALAMSTSSCLGLISCADSTEAANTAAAAPAATQTEDLVGFVPTTEYRVLVNDAQDENAEVFVSQQAVALLVLSDELPSPVLLRVQSREVEKLDASALVRQSNQAVVPAAARQGVATRFVPGNGEVVFSIEGTMARLVLDLPEPLVGEHQVEDLFAHSPEYRTSANAYAPDAQLLSELVSTKGEVRILTVFGSWCHVCKTYLPNLLRVQEELAERGTIDFAYLGIPDWDYPEVKRLKVSSLPTAIVYVDGREVGRVVGADGFRQVEKSLRDTLSGQ